MTEAVPTGSVPRRCQSTAPVSPNFRRASRSIVARVARAGALCAS
jgi:hypothetical protein